ncbi:uncharacterized protein LOC112515420 isoform X3 [Cynara cardunculus var. scolymus]|uniref:uncharacterized protein LOC112515420 isoform X3 n=1 Tax=Cynara cardunculus var. scolymus TaxID=59895 RepID=UPI000D6303CC|nr:uncharacterized protein LOC112515420 isoform X3 [Cynara cardunculus var. scolymus]
MESETMHKLGGRRLSSIDQICSSGSKECNCVLFDLCFQVVAEFTDGSRYNLPAEFLRVFSPSVDSKIRSIGGEKVIYGRRHVGIMSAEPVGNYGVTF